MALHPLRETAAGVFDSLADKLEASAQLYADAEADCERSRAEATTFDTLLNSLLERAFYRGGQTAMGITVEELRKSAAAVRDEEPHLKVVS